MGRLRKSAAKPPRRAVAQGTLRLPCPAGFCCFECVFLALYIHLFDSLRCSQELRRGRTLQVSCRHCRRLRCRQHRLLVLCAAVLPCLLLVIFWFCATVCVQGGQTMAGLSAATALCLLPSAPLPAAFCAGCLCRCPFGRMGEACEIDFLGPCRQFPEGEGEQGGGCVSASCRSSSWELVANAWAATSFACTHAVMSRKAQQEATNFMYCSWILMQCTL